MNYCQDRNIRSEKRWISNHDRLQKKLSAGYFRIDDKTIDDFSRFAAQYGKLISYFNDKNRPDGDWSVFFKNDPTISLFILQSLDTERFMEQCSTFLHLFEKAKVKESKVNALQNFVRLSTTLFDEVEQTISNLHIFNEFHLSLVKFINNRFSRFFSMVLEANKRLSESFQLDNPIVRNFDLNFKNYWFADTKFIISQDEDWLESLTALIAKGLPKMIHHVETLKQEATSFLNEQVIGSGNIKPHIALFITFCELYQEAQGKINNISERHLSYYYDQILQLKPAQGTNDSVYVNCNVTTGANAVQLEAGTKFVFQPENDPDGQDFVLESPVELFEGTIRKTFGINISNEVWTGAFMHRSTSEVAVYDLFNDENKEVEFGFEVSSESLILEEGDRRLTFDFSIDRVDMIGMNHSPSDLLALNESIAEAWAISYSSASGFQTVDANSIVIYFHGDGEKETMKLRFDILIRKHELPFVPLEKDNIGNEATLKFRLTKQGANLYTILRDITFSSVSLDLAVIGIKDLILSNEYGPLPIGMPFEPFGTRPKLGSSFIVGHKNLFLKPLHELNINIEWNNLPLDENGFKGYYKAYQEIEDNSSFKAKLSFLKDKNWIPAENKQVLDLFTGIPSDASLENNAVSVIRRLNEIDIQALGMNQESRIIGPLLEFSNSSTDGFIRMELCYPLAGFGHDQYLDLVQKAAFKSSKSKGEPELINEPYTPSIKSISLEYKSKIEIGGQGNKFKFRRFHAFASESIESGSKWSLLPQIPGEGCFFMGMSPLLSGKEISLLFKVRYYGEIEQKELMQGYRISYLDKNKWIELPSEKITDDSTRRFQSTGILKLKLPEINPFENSLDGESIWLRFDLPFGNMGRSIENVHLNAMLLRREKQMLINSDLVPAFSIEALKDAVVQIDKVEQPYQSFGGLKPESQDNFRLRASERIRHKSRGVSNRDIEQILLSRFTEIQSLKCMNHLDPSIRFTPGHVTIVVVPKGNQEIDTMERYFSKEDLLQMENYLISKALLGTAISVVNPVYEKIRLKFNVKFRNGINERLAIKKLHNKIITFLNPWTSDKLIDQGGLIPATVVLNEMELEDYVEYITNFSAFHIVDNQIVNLNTAQRNDLVIKANSPFSVLIPDIDHKLLPFNDKISTDKPGINDMMIGNDFLIKTKSDNASSGLGFEALEKTFKLSSSKENNKREKHIFTLYLKE